MVVAEKREKAEKAEKATRFPGFIQVSQSLRR
jgi:hypothetical protein